MSENLADFNTMLKSTDKPVFVMFSGNFCSPCRLVKPIFIEESNKNTKSIFVIVDVEDGEDICIEYKITKIPVIKVFINGIEQEQLNGSNTEALKKLIHKYNEAYISN